MTSVLKIMFGGLSAYVLLRLFGPGYSDRAAGDSDDREDGIELEPERSPIEEWIPWGKASAAPAQRGVYIMRCPKRRPAIVYIGKAENQGGLKARLSQYRWPGHDNRTSIRIRDAIAQEDRVEVTWIRTEEAAALERELLQEFELRFGKLPLWNRQRGISPRR